MTLSADALKLQISLMRREAGRRRAAADRLSEVVGDHGDSGYLLELLALELLLKAALRIHTGTSENSHYYRDLFKKLPAAKRASLVAAASARVGPEAPFTIFPAILKTWGANFVDLRYPYEKYEGMTEAEYDKVGAAWVASGASEATATFRYFPEQLYGFLFALEQDVDGWLARA